MTATWDQAQEKIGNAFTRSLVLHALVVGGLTGYAWWDGQGERFGDPNAGMPSVGVTAVDKIPIPTKGPENPVANDTDTDVPQEVEPAKPTPKEAPEPEPEDAVALKLDNKKQPKQPLTPKNRLKSFDEIASNQLTSKAPQAVSSPMFQAQGGSQVGMGIDSTLGTRFASYAAAVKEITRSNWHSEDVDRSIKNGPPVTVSFEIQRDGRATGIRLTRKSGIASLDDSVTDAIENSKYPPLPAEYDKSSASVQFTFELKR